MISSIAAIRLLVTAVITAICATASAQEPATAEQAQVTASFEVVLGKHEIEAVDNLALILGESVDIKQNAHAASAIIPAPQWEFSDGNAWVLHASMTYQPGNAPHRITVPDGFVHDGASIPRAFWQLIPKSGPYNKAAIVHDFLYWAQPCSRLQSDNLMLLAMTESGVSSATKAAIYRAVRIGGEAAWSANQLDRQHGLPRIIPAGYRVLPAMATWPVYRKQLAAAGIAPEPRVVGAPYCQYGDSVEVPAEQA